MSAARRSLHGTVTLGRALPVASPVTWFIQFRTTWQIGTNRATGARTVLRSSCSSSSSSAGASREAGWPFEVRTDRCVGSSSSKHLRFDPRHTRSMQVLRGRDLRTERGCLPPASISPSSFLSISSSSTARTDGERTDEGGQL